MSPAPPPAPYSPAAPSLRSLAGTAQQPSAELSGSPRERVSQPSLCPQGPARPVNWPILTVTVHQRPVKGVMQRVLGQPHRLAWSDLALRDSTLKAGGWETGWVKWEVSMCGGGGNAGEGAVEKRKKSVA